MVSGRVMMIRTCPSLIIAPVVEDRFRRRFSGTPFDCVFVLPFFCRLPRSGFSEPLRPIKIDPVARIGQ